ncbi:MAG TPA: UDP-N-acetylglucosamine-peptide N-acetylglucosaminyltransferase [Dyella sp.]|uniref:O-linked N-acetylglucosamine transferase, SPINDLY family protein n=1 Tax=Dyella sp. TaxID=1869338 RepID=UPI002F925E76
MSRKSWNALFAEMTGEVTISLDRWPPDRLERHLRDMEADVVKTSELGNALFHAGLHRLAMACYSVAAEDERALGARLNLGRCRIRLGDWGVAEREARAMLAADERHLAAWHLLGEALEAGAQYAQAAEALRQAVALAPDHALLHLQWGEMCEEADDIETALLAYRRAYELDPRNTRALRLLLFAKRNLCDWSDLDVLSGRLKTAVASGDAFEAMPFDFLVEGAGPALEQMCARAQAARMVAKAAREPLPAAVAISGTKVRVGFVSNGFGLHPTTLLTSAMFEHLREHPLEVHLFSTRSDEGQAQRERLAAAVHRFHAMHGCTPRAIAERIRACSIDVLVDLDGYRRARMPQVFAYRPAPVQVNWMAYPGTIGAAYMDHVIADRIVLPEGLQPFFDERAVYLPRCFQSTDPTRKVGMPPPREMCGLPPEPAVVYVCFNASFKLAPRSFMRMLRVLEGVPGSVLWLLKGPGRADQRLRDTARKAGIDPERLVFMAKRPHLDYLSMYRHADLFLDNDVYNAHTTASDALWAGCPVLTRPGEAFAGRVAASLNHHLGMPEMNVQSDAEYVDRAVAYGRDIELRRCVREKLIRLRDESGLFDMAGFAEDFAGLLLGLAAGRRMN